MKAFSIVAALLFILWCWWVWTGDFSVMWGKGHHNITSKLENIGLILGGLACLGSLAFAFGTLWDSKPQVWRTVYVIAFVLATICYLMSGWSIGEIFGSGRWLSLLATTLVLTTPVFVLLHFVAPNRFKLNPLKPATG